MDRYLMMLYVTLDQETALKHFFIEHGWAFSKPDLSITTDNVGPSIVPASNVEDTTERMAEFMSPAESLVALNQSVCSNLGRKRKKLTVARNSLLAKHPKSDLSELQSEETQCIDSSHSDVLTQSRSVNLTFPVTVRCENEQQVVIKLERADDELELTHQTHQNSGIDVTNNILDEIEGNSDNDNSENTSHDFYSNVDQPSADSGVETVIDTKEDILEPDMKRISVDSHVICRYCGDLFRSLSTLKQHESKHSHIAPYQCNICGQMNFSKSSHKLHLMRKHAGSKSYHCIKCGKSFATEIDLKRHNDRENKMYKYKCDFCNYACEKKSELKDHESSHTGTFNHFCNICGKQYRHRSSLRNHLQLHKHLEYKCELCEKKFRTKINISRHVRLVHKKKSVC